MPWSSYSDIAKREDLIDVIVEAGQVNLDDLAGAHPGGVVRVKSPDAIQRVNRGAERRASESRGLSRGLNIPMSLALGAATGCGFLPWRK